MSEFKTPGNIVVPIGTEQKEEVKPVANNSEHIRLHSNIPKRYAGAKFEASTPEQEKLVTAIRNNISGKAIEDVRDMLIMGTVGTGKTHIIAGALNSLIDSGIYCKYATEYDLLDMYFTKAKATKDSEPYSKFKTFKESKFLVVDELGKRELLDWQKIQIEELISYRYNEMLPTFFITNLTASEFKAFVGDRIADRMRDNSVIRVSLTGDSLRGRA